MTYTQFKSKTLQDNRSKFTFISDNRNHYVYRVTDLITSEHQNTIMDRELQQLIQN